MEQDRLIVIKELTKGNDSIVTFNKSHERLKAFKPLVSKKVAVEESSMLNTESQYGVVTQKQYEPPQISILYGVNAATLPFFSTVGYTKGSTLPSNEIRNLVTTYVKDNELIHGRRVTLDPILHDSVCEKHENITAVAWEELFKRLISKMQVNHQLQFPGLKPIIKKGDPPTVDISIAQRSGNKKVTLVKNLENFLIDPQDFADTIRKLAQASTSVSTLPNSKPAQILRQVLVQGNQVNGVESILTGDLYRLPRKYLKGLQNAPKSKVKQKR
ncbi:unnamed protein product [Clavelina lepadiformis]|uniref:SUI1 domain-containing protein n=1 Tax=Clavelina lepadiformis TaxID=159417 RepID=A0ABP0FNQ8_CLALP